MLSTKWFGDNDNTMAIGSIRPAGDERDALIYRRFDESRILQANGQRLIAFRQELALHDLIGMLLARIVQNDNFANGQIDQITKNFSMDVVVPVNHRVARLSEWGTALMPSSLKTVRYLPL